jgi:hypothetical protein
MRRVANDGACSRLGGGPAERAHPGRARDRQREAQGTAGAQPAIYDVVVEDRLSADVPEDRAANPDDPTWWLVSRATSPLPHTTMGIDRATPAPLVRGLVVHMVRLRWPASATSARRTGAVMALAGMAPDVMKPTALLLNTIVALIATIRFGHAGRFSWRIFWPFMLGSVPFAAIGGAAYPFRAASTR